MKTLGKRVKQNIVEPNEEQRALLPSSRDPVRCSSLSFGNQEIPIELLLSQLAEIIVEAYFHEQNKPTNNN